MTVDCIVIGCGIAGAATASQLAARGLSSLTIEQNGRGKLLGSSGGETRLYRSSYFEGSLFVPYLFRAQALWRELARTSPEPILRETGGLYLGLRRGALVEGAISSAKAAGLPYKLLDSTDVASRFPMFRVSPEEMGFWEPSAGILYSDACVRQLVRQAERQGAAFRFNSRAKSWTSDPTGVTVETNEGPVRARTLVLTAGSWTPTLVPELRGRLELERQVMFWFKPRPHAPPFDATQMPVFVWQIPGQRTYYGVPDVGRGAKVATENGIIVRTPRQARRQPTPVDLLKLRDFLKSRLPGLVARPIRSRPCVYTNAPDRRFLLGVHPKHSNVVIISACSGHGFKFGTVVGELAATVAQSGSAQSSFPPFDPARFMN